jgi:hypothetical protein
MRNNIYINNRNITVNIDRKIMQNDTSRYRGEIIRNVQLHSERTGHLTPPGRVKQAGSVPSGNPSPVRSEITNVYRGRDIQNSQPVSQTGYGGYGSSKEAASYRERGQASRQNMQQFTRQAPAQRQPVSTGKPAQRPAPQAPHQAPAGGVRR